ncbi:hypothetical protein [Lutibacter sp.]|uniref:hypothetical protein n=1 Tax=Lutibacter sp. TaxID=1925666 RepID=UPI00356A5331
MKRLQVKKSETIAMVKELNDMFEIYLDTEIASDTNDRRNKLNAIKHLNSIFS